MATDRTSALKTNHFEMVKQYVEYDDEERPETVYEAHTDAAHGTPCLKTVYEYADATSTRVVKRKESSGTWDSSYDIT